MNFRQITFFCLLYIQCYTMQVESQNKIHDFGINLTGLERYWEIEKTDYKDILDDIDKLHTLGFRDIRLPISFKNQFKNTSKRKFLKRLKRIVKYIKKRKMTLIVCYFDNEINAKTLDKDLISLSTNWVVIAKKIKKYHNFVYYEILNEPNLYPKEWDKLATKVISEIRKVDKKTKIVIGATNYNSIYELSRKIPYSFNNLIYSFHFYEPFLFTHQGASWVGNQNKTIGLPYPYETLKMPVIHEEIIGTSGEKNYKMYNKTANKIALSHKIKIVADWAKEHNIILWCTEFGAIKSIATKYRCNYYKDLLSVLKEKNIKSYLWEYNGNFGIKNDKDILDCF